MDEKVWEFIKYLYKDRHHVPPIVVEYMACYEILLDCASGRSNGYIANKFELPYNYVRDLLSKHLNFAGWLDDLDISPIMVYDSFDGDWNYYRTTIKNVSCLTTPDEIKLSFSLCRRFDKIRKEYNHVK